MKIAFMGTPEFAVPSLQALTVDHEVVGVFCQPDRPKGRSKQPMPCAVKQAALGLDLTVLQPQRASVQDTINWVVANQIDWLVVAAYGQILSQALLDSPRHGCVNVHASLLPRWRGASPIHHVLLNGETETGISLMGMVKKLDAGPIFVQERLEVDPQERRSQLEDRLAHLGANLLKMNLHRLDAIIPQPQDETLVSYAGMIDKAMGMVNFEDSAQHIANQIRAFEGWPGVWAQFRGQPVRLDQVETLAQNHDAAPGSFLLEPKKDLVIACGHESALRLADLQPAGKKVLTAMDFINGFRPKTEEGFQNGTLN